MIEHYKNKSLENISEVIDGVLVTEMWKDIEDYEGFYQISNFGRCKSLARTVISKNGVLFNVKERILSSSVDKGGYNRIVLQKDKICKNKQIHRLVAQAFIENRNNYPMVLHKVESIPSNDFVGNLFWGDSYMNMQDMVAKGRNDVKKGEKNFMFGKVGCLCMHSKIVLDTQTGIYYDSAKEAAEAKGHNYDFLRAKLNGNRKNNTSLIYA